MATPAAWPSARTLAHPLLLYPMVLAAGAITGVAGAPRDLPALVYGGLAAFAFLLARGLESAEPRRAWRRGLALSWLYGFTINAIALRFSVGLLVDFGHMPLPVAVLLSLLLWGAQSLVHAMAGAAVGALAEAVPRERRAVLVYALLPVALVVAEQIVPMLFPWRLAAALSSWVPMMQAAELGGEPLLTALITGCACTVAAWGDAPAGRRRHLLAAGAAALVLVPFVYGLWRVAVVEAERAAAPLLRVGLVQPNVGIREKGHDELAYRHFENLVELSRDLERRGADVVVWPETAAPFSMRRSTHREPEGPWSLLDNGVQGPVLMGVVTWHSILRKHNSAVLMRSDGTYAPPADKVELIPFGEYTPFWTQTRSLLRAVWPTAPFRPFFERAKGFTPGDEAVLIETPRPGARPGDRVPALARLGVMICYEDTLPALGLRVFHARGGPPDLLVNMTNDAWFGDGDEPHLHLALSRFRAVETRRDLVRAVNTGVSAAVTATGVVTQRTGTFVRGGILARARLLSGTTPYMMLGDWPVAIGYALLLALALGRRAAKPA